MSRNSASGTRAVLTRAEVGWPALRAHVFQRDGGCMAPQLDPTVKGCNGRLTVDHIKEQPRMGKRAPDDEAHLVSMCVYHHLGGWATAHRPELRAYLREAYPEIWRS